MCINRADTRKTLKKYLTANGKLRPPAKDILKKSIPAIVANICEKYPLDEKAALKYAHHFISGTQHECIHDILFESLRNLPNFAEWFALQYDHVSPTVAWLREVGDSTRRNILENRCEIEKIFSTQTALGISNDTISAAAKKNIESIMAELPKSFLPNIAKKWGYFELPTVELQDLPLKAPSMYTAICFMSGMMQKSLQPLANERSPKTSDAGDILHSFYLPHVDFFRTDKFAASVIREIKLPFSTTIVGSLHQLPEAISRRLAEKNAL